MTVKRILLLACLLALLSGCGAKESIESEDGAPAPMPEQPEISEPETIDPYEKAATISAPEEPTDSTQQAVASTDGAAESEIEWTEGGEQSPSSSASPAQVENKGPSEATAGAISPAADSSAPEASSTADIPASRSALRSSAAQAGPGAAADGEGEEIPAARKQEQAESPRAARSAQSESGVSGIEQELIRLINDERARNGIEALGVEDGMQLAAGIRAREALQSLSHTRPDGTPYYTTFDEAGFSYAGKWHGENLAMISMGSEDYDESAIAQALFRQWLESPGHQQNMLGDFLQTGIGVYIEWDEDTVRVGAAQLFAGM